MEPKIIEIPSFKVAGYEFKNNLKNVYSKYKKTKIQSVLKKPMTIWNNQNYTIGEDYISFPVMVNGKSKKIKVKAIIEQYQNDLLINKLGKAKKSNKIKSINDKEQR